MTLRRHLCLPLTLAAALFFGMASSSAEAYIIKPLPTLGFTAVESTYVILVRVEKVSLERGVIIYRKVRNLNGRTYPNDTLKHVFNMKAAPAVAGEQFRPESDEWGQILQWAEPGKEAVTFIRKQNNGGDCSLTYVDQSWYASSSSPDDWVWFHTLYASPDLLRKYFCGSPSRLANAMETMFRTGGSNDNIVVPVLGEGSPVELRQGRATVRGLTIKSGGVVRLDWNLKRDTANFEDLNSAEALAKQLQDKDQAVRLKAANEIAHWVGPEITTSKSALIAGLKHDDAMTRRACASALANSYVDPEEAVPALCGALKESDSEVVVRACEALRALGGKAQSATSPLREVLRLDALRSQAAAAALVSIDPASEREIPGVTEQLQRQASRNGRYKNLLTRIEVPQALSGNRFLRDESAVIGAKPPIAEYQGHKSLPAGYWVYVYPHWYIWGGRSDAE